MGTNVLKVSTLGLDYHGDMIIRLLLSVVAGRTSVPWRRVESFCADLIFCSPTSALAAVAVRKATTTGRPLCLSLLGGPGQVALPGTRAVSATIQVDDFITLLDEAAERICTQLPATQVVLEPARRPLAEARAAVDRIRAAHAVAAGVGSPAWWIRRDVERKAGTMPATA